MLSHEIDPQTRKFKCSHCSKAFKFKHHLKVRLGWFEEKQRCSTCSCRSRNMYVFIRGKSHSSVPIVANGSLIRVPIPRTWHQKSVMPIHNQHWILIYIRHPAKYRHRRQASAILPWLLSWPHVPCWISVPLLWLPLLRPLPNNNNSTSKEKIPTLPHPNLIPVVHHHPYGPICPRPSR